MSVPATQIAAVIPPSGGKMFQMCKSAARIQYQFQRLEKSWSSWTSRGSVIQMSTAFEAIHL
ncbi:hypothetical protein N7486_010011 [Penicillium sp. IBT 16267x]|nr:hypothetical protein N7486_010011 [Penicillium sp. IBT 16267x]